MKPKVSIIIPVLDGEATLRDCALSILEQNFRDFELIFVDNASADSTPTIMKELALRDPRIVLSHEPERSRGKARRKGESAAQGEIIVMTDADCIARDRSWLESLIRPILSGKADAVQGGEEAAGNGFWDQRAADAAAKKTSNAETISGDKIIGTIDTKNFAIRAGTLRSVLGTSAQYPSGNDTKLSFQLSRANCRLGFAADAKVAHRGAQNLAEHWQKQARRGYWTARIARDNREAALRSDFRRRAGLTLGSHIGFALGLIGKILRLDFAGFSFSLIDGLAWRSGAALELASHFAEPFASLFEGRRKR